jgi:cytochrome oxidase Cu insertion factor (SCO1/SenC/PrrC family)
MRYPTRKRSSVRITTARWLGGEDHQGREGDRAMTTIKKGDKAPEFALPDPAGKTVKLVDFKGRKLLVYFFPKAGTSG